MVKLTMAGCAHKRVMRYEMSDEAVWATCMTCYVRLIGTLGATSWAVDGPVTFMCDHSSKNPIEKQGSYNPPFHDALCTKCGTVLRHPDGPGGWTEVVFSGFIITEEP